MNAWFVSIQAKNITPASWGGLHQQATESGYCVISASKPSFNILRSLRKWLNQIVSN